MNNDATADKRAESAPLRDTDSAAWLRGPDLNRQPSGYEPDELPGCSTPRHMVEGEGFEPSKASANRFTVCPSWPLWYPSTLRATNTIVTSCWWVVKTSRSTNARVLMAKRSWSQRWESNPQPPAYKAGALPIELRWHSEDIAAASMNHSSILCWYCQAWRAISLSRFSR
jgi:hypothetical protein